MKSSKTENIYFDATSLSIKNLNQIVACVPNAKIVLVLFDNSVNSDFCIKNVKKDISNKVDRSNTPDEVIKKMSERYKSLVSSKQFELWIKSHDVDIIHVK